MRHITYDVDGVLAPWFQGFMKLLEHLDGLHLDPDGPCSYDMKTWVGVDDDAFILDRIARYHSDEGGFFSNIGVIDGAVEAVQAIRKAGFSEVIVTKCGTDPIVTALRSKYIRENFGQIGIHFVGMDESKEPILQALPKGIYIDDHPENAEMGRRCGHDTLLYNWRFNAGFDAEGAGIRRVYNWAEITDIVLGMTCEKMMDNTL